MMPAWGEESDTVDWESGVNYSLGDMVTPGNGYAYEVVDNEGISGLEPDSWPEVFGETVMDSHGVKYECSDYHQIKALKPESEVFNIPTPYELPQAYYGFFEINGPLTGARRHHMTANKLSMGGTKEKLLADARWEGSGGRYPDGTDIGIEGKVWRTEVYGFYVLWGLRWIEIAIPYMPFGQAKVFPIQPEIKMKNISPKSTAQKISSRYNIRVITNPGG